MARITALTRNKGRVNVFLDGEMAFCLSSAVASGEGLHLDQALTPEEAALLVKRDRFQRGLNTATRYLNIRPRSDAELRTKLRSHGYDAQTQASVIEALKANGLLDDKVFAQYWAENRDSFSPRSRSLTRMELRKKGISKDIIEKAVGTIDDEDNAYRAASGHLRSIHWSDHEQFRRRLGGYLERRGFSYQVIESTIKKIWQEIAKEDISSTGDPDY